jgi:hypothetical protein
MGSEDQVLMITHSRPENELQLVSTRNRLDIASVHGVV